MNFILALRTLSKNEDFNLFDFKPFTVENLSTSDKLTFIKYRNHFRSIQSKAVSARSI